MPQTTPLLMRHRSAAILAMLAVLGCARGRQQKAQTAAVCPTENDELVADAPPYPTYLAEVRLALKRASSSEGRLPCCGSYSTRTGCRSSVRCASFVAPMRASARLPGTRYLPRASRRRHSTDVQYPPGSISRLRSTEEPHKSRETSVSPVETCQLATSRPTTSHVDAASALPAPRRAARPELPQSTVRRPGA